MLNSFYYSFLAFPLSLIVVSYYIYLPKWYADNFGATVGTLGLYILLVRLFDAFTDPLCGVLSDALVRRGFSRLVFLIPGTVLLSVSFFALLAPSYFAPVNINLYFLFVSLAFYLGSTLVSVPYEALGVSTSGVKTRPLLLGFRDLNVILGTLFASAVPVFIFEKIQYPTKAIEVIGLGYSSILVVSLFILFLYKSDIRFPASKSSTSVPKLKDLLIVPLKLPQFRKLALSYFISGLGMALPASLFLFFCEIVLKLDSSQANLSLLLYFGIGILFLPVWAVLSKRFSMLPLWFTAQVINAGFFLPVAFLDKGDFMPFLVLISLSALGFGGSFMLPSLIQARIVDLSNQNNIHDSTGIFMGFWAVIKKFSQAIGSGVGLYVVGVSGLDAGDFSSENLDFVLRGLYAVVPSVMCLGSIFFAWGIRLGRE